RVRAIHRADRDVNDRGSRLTKDEPRSTRRVATDTREHIRAEVQRQIERLASRCGAKENGSGILGEIIRERDGQRAGDGDGRRVNVRPRAADRAPSVWIVEDGTGGIGPGISDRVDVTRTCEQPQSQGQYRPREISEVIRK